jgi:hypothetical protein
MVVQEPLVHRQHYHRADDVVVVLIMIALTAARKTAHHFLGERIQISESKNDSKCNETFRVVTGMMQV